MSGEGRKPPGPPSPWLKGVVGVTGVVPPGRRLSPDARPNRWSASGVTGVVPPGKMPAGQVPGEHLGTERDWLKANLRTLQKRRRSIDEDGRPGAPRPQAGFLPDVFADISDPPDLQDFLKLLSEFLDRHPPREDAIADIDHLIAQSHAPFELVVGFTVMSTLVDKNDGLRQEFATALERGANAFFNLARRLNSRIRVPRGVIPEVLDALFYDLPSLAQQVPFAFATDSFTRIMPLLRTEGDEVYDERLLRFAVRLRKRFIASRSFGDQPLDRLFPWTTPDWAPRAFQFEDP